MNALPYLAGLATRHAWARRQYAELHADIVEAQLAARARAADSAGHRRVALRERLGRRPGLRQILRPDQEAASYCRRAAARSAHVARVAGGAR